MKNGDSVLVDIVGGGSVTIIASPTSNIKNLKIDFGGDDDVADEVTIELETFKSYGLHIDIKDYDPTDSVILNNAFNRRVDPGNEDEYNFEYIGSNGATFDGFLRAKDKDENDFTENPKPIIVCFAEGTLLDTDLGPTAIECLVAGDLVRTRGHDLQPIKWIGHRRLDSLDLVKHPNLAPVRIAANSLGNGLPYVDLIVSPQHRILIEGWKAELYFGEIEILVPAIALEDGASVRVLSDVASVVYYHILFDRHEIVTSNGVPTESMLIGDMALSALDDTDRDEIRLLFGNQFETFGNQYPARPIFRRRDAEVLKAG